MEFDINFDEASLCWRENKKYMGKGYFVYLCSYIHSNGKHCRSTVYSQTNKNPYSVMHENFELNDRRERNPKAGTFCKKHINRPSTFMS